MAHFKASAGTSHVVANQDAVFSFLSDPQTHHLAPDEHVVRIDTHGAVVFLAGPFAYKVKRAVYFPFMDFSTLEKRHAACEAELRIGQANAPELYLDIVPITRNEQGLILGGSRSVVEYAVRMQRFDLSHTLDHVVEQGELSPQLMTALAQVLSVSHQRAPVVRDHDASASFLDFMADNRQAFLADAALFPPEQTNALCDEAERTFLCLRTLLEARGRAGYVRRCHGDLHLRNIVLLKGRPVLFDAIEFNDEIATCDILYDLAFLLMDLWERGLHATANGIFNRYMRMRDESDNLDGLKALPFFLSMRAAIRAKVEAAGLGHLSGRELEEAEERVRHLFLTARSFLLPSGLKQAPPQSEGSRTPALPTAISGEDQKLVAIGGLSGTGKSTCAMAWAPYVGRAPGALILRSDVERKLMFAVAETEPLPQHAYAHEVTERVYARLITLAGRILATGHSIIVDAVHAAPEERAAIEKVARDAAVPFIGIWLETDIETRIERINKRTDDASDANEDIARRQQGYDIGEIGSWISIKSR